MSDLLAGRKVLVIEDEMLIVLMIEDMLADLGCEAVTTAATVEQAIERIDEQVFDLAMLDMNLAGENSEAVADALTEHRVPFIYSTGNASRDKDEASQQSPVLRKPFKFEALERMLRSLLASSQQD